MTTPEILLIDDDPIASALRKKVLECKGYRVQMALDGPSGIAIAEAIKPALIMLDHRFPGMSGPEVMAVLRTMLPNTPLISLSGQECISSFYSVQPDAYLLKGVSIPAMFDTIASLLP